MRAIIYSRVSLDPDGRGRSVSEQEAECRAVCQRAGWDVVEVVQDNDRSASRYATKARPGFAHLVRQVDAGAADILVVWEASRFQRDLEVYVQLRELCRKRGVLWSYSGRTYDLSRTDDRLSTGLDALLAERESDLTRERVLRATRAAAAEGRPHGKLLYGYARGYEQTPKGPRLVAQVIREDHALIIRECADRVLAGVALYEIAQDLNARGVPAPRGALWIGGQVKRLCTNPSYIGKRTHLGVVVGDALWPPILEERVHLGCVARLSDPARRTNDGRARKHLLTGIAVCGLCGGRMVVLKNRGRLAYSCHDLWHVSRVQQPVDAFVTAVIIERLQQPDVLDLMHSGDDTAAAEARALAQELRDRLSGFCDVAAMGELTPAALARIEAKLLPQIADAEKRSRAAIRSTALLEAVGPDSAAKWALLTLSQRREVIAALVTIRLLPVGRGRRTFDPASIEITPINGSGTL